jgi:hypothetical protein
VTHGAAHGNVLAVGGGSNLYESETGVCGPFKFLKRLWPPSVVGECAMSHNYQPENSKGYYQFYGICILNYERAADDNYFYVGAWKTLADFKTGEDCTADYSTDCAYLLKIKSDILAHGVDWHNTPTAVDYSTQFYWWNPNITRVEDGVLFLRFIWAPVDRVIRARGKGMVNLPAAAKLSDDSV